MEEVSGLLINPGGDGEYRTLLDALSDCPAGAVLRLSSGIHTIDKAITIEKAITLIGEGIQKTYLVSEDNDFVVCFAATATSKASDLTFQHKGTAPANVVKVLSGEVQFIRCGFTGGVDSNRPFLTGDGLT